MAEKGKPFSRVSETTIGRVYRVVETGYGGEGGADPGAVMMRVSGPDRALGRVWWGSGQGGWFVNLDGGAMHVLPLSDDTTFECYPLKGNICVDGAGDTEEPGEGAKWLPFY